MQRPDCQGGVRRQNPADAQHINEGSGLITEMISTLGPMVKLNVTGSHAGFSVASAQFIENTGIFLLSDEGLCYLDAVDALGNIGGTVGLLVGLDLPCTALLFS